MDFGRKGYHSATLASCERIACVTLGTTADGSVVANLNMSMKLN